MMSSPKNLFQQLTLAAAIALLSSCGEKEKEQEQTTSAGNQSEPKVSEQDTAAAKAKDQAEAKAQLQQSLIDEAIALIERVADAAISVEDLPSAQKAAADIAVIDTEFKALSLKMAEAGDPTPALVSKFRQQYTTASDSMRERIRASMPDLAGNTEVASLLNKTFTEFGKTLSHPAFKAYGIDGS